MTDNKTNADSLVGAELDELDDDFNFDDDEISIESSADVFETPVDGSKKTSSKNLMISISLVFVIVLMVVGYFYIYDDNSGSYIDGQVYDEAPDAVVDTDNQAIVDSIDEYNDQDGAEVAEQNGRVDMSLLGSLVAENNEELFLRLNQILSDNKTEFKNDIKSQSKIAVDMAVDKSMKKMKLWINNYDQDADTENNKLTESAMSEATQATLILADDMSTRFTEFNSQISELEQKLTTVGLISASTNADLQEIISSYKKENNNLTERMLALESRLASFSPATTREFRPAIIKSIKDFKSYSLIGFDRQKMAVWLKDDDDNVIKVKKTSFLPEYGTVISITENGKIATELGFVKIKAAKDLITQPAK